MKWKNKWVVCDGTIKFNGFLSEVNYIPCKHFSYHYMLEKAITFNSKKEAMLFCGCKNMQEMSAKFLCVRRLDQFKNRKKFPTIKRKLDH